MPNKKKIIGELEETVLKLLREGYNPYSISHKVGGAVTKETIKKFAKEKGIPIRPRYNPEKDTQFKQDEFVSLIRKGLTLTEARKKAGVHSAVAHKLIDSHGLRSLVRTRAQAALDKTLPIEEAQKRVPEGEGVVLGFENGKYRIQCSDGFIYFKSSAKLYQGDPRVRGSIPWTMERLNKLLSDKGYEYVDGFRSARVSFRARHLVCGTIRETDLKCYEKYGCLQCNNTGISKAETELKDWIESLGFKTIKRKLDGNKTKHKNIDIYIPSLGLNIEYNGLFFHSEAKAYSELYYKYKHSSVSWDDLLKFESRVGNVRKFPFEKMDKINKMGERLITVFENEWVDRNYQVKGFLKSILGVSDRKVYARDCKVVQIGRDIGSSFITENHIQKDSKKALVYYGLYLEQELLGVMEGGSHHRGDRSGIVLSRLCFKSGVQVVGGASKLLHHLIRFAKEQGYSKIVSWSDNRWSQGNVYQKLGFLLEEDLPPDYSYYKNGSLYSKQSKKKNPERDEMSKTEYELRLAEGFYRIYDCGKKRWVLPLTPTHNPDTLKT